MNCCVISTYLYELPPAILLFGMLILVQFTKSLLVENPLI